MPATHSASPFGHVLSAVVTPMAQDGSVDLAAFQALCVDLVDAGHDGLVVNGTTGESPTTTDAEKVAIVRAAKEAVGDRAAVVAGAGSNVTAHTVEMVRAAADAGADGLLVVTPYYNRPPQAGLVAHFEAAADASDLPVMLYDIPARSGVPLAYETLLRLGEHPRIQAVKDAKGDLWQATKVMEATGLAWYSGNDADNLTHLAHGATGIVGVTSQVAPAAFAAQVAAARRGDLAELLRLHRALVPVVDAVMNQTQGAIAAKAALAAQGRIPGDHLRLPLLPATDAERTTIQEALAGLDAITTSLKEVSA